VIQPSPFDDVTQPPKLKALQRGARALQSICQELANREKLNVADLNAPVVAALEKARATDAELAKDYSRPRPSWARWPLTHGGRTAEVVECACDGLRGDIQCECKKLPDAKGTKMSDLKSGTRFPGPNSTRPADAG